MTCTVRLALAPYLTYRYCTRRHTRPTPVARKTVQVYYGHRNRPYLANDSGIPATLWRDHPDSETRAFYGVLNERTRTYMAAFGPKPVAID